MAAYGNQTYSDPVEGAGVDVPGIDDPGLVDPDQGVEVKCYEDSTFDTICMGSTDINGFDICVATMNGRDCRSCVSDPYASYCYDSLGAEYKYKVDCGNVNYKFNNVKVCGDKMEATYTEYTRSYSSGGGGR